MEIIQKLFLRLSFVSRIKDLFNHPGCAYCEIRSCHPRPKRALHLCTEVDNRRSVHLALYFNNLELQKVSLGFNAKTGPYMPKQKIVFLFHCR
jgi:hypothetical protein